MRKSLHSLVLTGMMTMAAFIYNAPTHAQHKIDWINPDIPYIEQRGFSLGVTMGFTDMWADVGTKSLLDHYGNSNYYNKIGDNLRGMGSFFVRYTYVPGISFRAGVGYGALYATDEWNKDKGLKAKTIKDDSYQRYIRNLDAHTNVWEASLLFEMSPFRLSNWEFGKMAKSRFQPYLLLGAAGFHFNPKGTMKDLTTGNTKIVELQPLHTEGQNFSSPDVVFPKNYSLWSYAAVGGIGVKFDVGKGLGLGLEYQLRYTFTDYLDDVSGKYIDPQYMDIGYMNQPGKAKQAQNMADRSSEIIPGYKHQPGEFRGNPDNNDMYSSVSVMFYWKIKKKKSPWWE